jgi:hypothetical protein
MDDSYNKINHVMSLYEDAYTKLGEDKRILDGISILFNDGPETSLKYIKDNFKEVELVSSESITLRATLASIMMDPKNKKPTSLENIPDDQFVSC